MKVLTVNCGSSSLKYKLFDMPAEGVLAKGGEERLPADGSGHEAAVRRMLDGLCVPRSGALASLDELAAVGHRVVHGGPRYREPVLADAKVLADVDSYAVYAPLHNPANAAGIRLTARLAPRTPQVAVFDTAFHHDMPPYATHYGIDDELAEKHGIRRYGFHGLSHQYVSARMAALMERPLSELRLVTCHIGSGTSICAVDRGRSVDTSMGMTPVQGVIMGTRSGTLDPSIVELLMEKEGLDYKGILELLNRKSGLRALSGLSGDMRDLEKAAAGGDARARLALDVHAHQIKKFIGSYIFVMGGADGLVFTAGIGENSARLRAEICARLDFMGGALDGRKNRELRGEGFIEAAGSKVRIAVIPTNEELVIARAAAEVVRDAGRAA
jgi:acetate kinase